MPKWFYRESSHEKKNRCCHLSTWIPFRSILCLLTFCLCIDTLIFNELLLPLFLKVESKEQQEERSRHERRKEEEAFHRHWTQHIKQRQQYVKDVLEAIPDTVKNNSCYFSEEWRTCQSKLAEFAAAGSLELLQTPSQLHHGSNSPSNNVKVSTGTKHAIVVPYRDREYHLHHFKKYMSSYLQNQYQNQNHTFILYIVEQDDQEPFQRSFLLNAALDHVDHDVHCVTMHDVDLVPIFFSPVPYHVCERPTRLSNKLQTFDWGLPYDKSFGGVVNLHQHHWALVNGMGNQFRGWGVEDDELYVRLVYRALVDCDTGYPAGPGDQDHGIFMAISQNKTHHHERDYTDFSRNHRLNDLHKSTGVSNSMIDGWSLNKYEVTSHTIEDTTQNDTLKGFTEIHHIKVINRAKWWDV